MEYANAIKILPEDLIAEIKKYFPGGGMLFIPKEGLDRKERARLVVQLMEQNVPVKEVARLADLTPRHVRGLVRKCSASRKAGAENI
jgi:hypothetical protein